jgi:succinyl-CoA synthetase beta subunit
LSKGDDCQCRCRQTIACSIPHTDDAFYQGSFIKIHEYQARQILSDHGIPVPPAEVARTPDEAAAAFKKFAAPMCVVKAQVYAGGRGKAGFVKLVKSAEEAREAAKFMLSNRMVSVQTGPEGVGVSVLLVSPGVDIAK